MRRRRSDVRRRVSRALGLTGPRGRENKKTERFLKDFYARAARSATWHFSRRAAEFPNGRHARPATSRLVSALVVARAGTMASSSSLARTSPTLARCRARSSPSSSSSSSSRRAARRRATTTTPRASSAPLGTPLSPPTEIDRALFGDGAYAPSPMDASTMQSQGVVLLVVGIMTAYWWYVLVPGARVNLAVNKKSGRLRAYLEDLKTDDGRKLERFFYAKWLAKVDPETRYLLRDEPDDEGEAGEVAAKTMLSDTEGVTRDVGEESVEEIVRRAKRTPKFWSGDNPVLVGAALSIGAAGLFGVIPH